MCRLFLTCWILRTMKDVRERITEFKDVSLCMSECNLQNFDRPAPVAARSKAWVSRRWLAGIADSNPAGGIDFCVL